ncbi:MAG: AAA domain-containing protein [Tissierellia bacterium]|nr:AAA domain-containing protein [Tissierellia bacterium]
MYDNLLVGRKITASPKSAVVIELVEDEDTQYEIHAKLLNFNPNLILYGPPGTGKTYATTRIIDHFEKKYYGIDSGFKKAEEENRVQSITFHQSYSYEEFIEGIRPILNDAENGEIGYKLENGIFKDLCISAEKELLKRDNNADYVDMITSGSRVWKVSLGERKSDAIFNECIKEDDITIGWLEDLDLSNISYSDISSRLKSENNNGSNPTQDANSINSFVNVMAVGDIVLVYNGQQTIRMIGIIKSDYKHAQKQNYRHRRSVDWFKKLNYPINVYKQNGYKNMTLKTIYELSRISISDVIEMVRENSQEDKTNEAEKEVKPYYMIIDEINRGNISKIFGELITLIEKDKRGLLKSTLPYSKKEFSVPMNLYIIGTMNTADRSIAVIDTALRRRFTFVEVEPDSEIVTQSENSIINDTIDLSQLLDALNVKIMEKYDRDHRIGHAYFMGMELLQDLYQTWYYKILPLLGEYFYNDVETLSSIVGKSFFDQYGNTKYLPVKSNDGDLSAFEESLIKIYRVKDNE